MSKNWFGDMLCFGLDLSLQSVGPAKYFLNEDLDWSKFLNLDATPLCCGLMRMAFVERSRFNKDNLNSILILFIAASLWLHLMLPSQLGVKFKNESQSVISCKPTEPKQSVTNAKLHPEEENCQLDIFENQSKAAATMTLKRPNVVLLFTLNSSW